MTFYEMPDKKLVTFTKFPDWLMYTDLSPGARLSYLALWSHYDPKTGKLAVHPSIKRIAWLANIGTTCARRGIRELEDFGLILTKGRAEMGGGPNEYLLYEPSETEIRVLVDRRKQKCLTCDDAKSQSSDQASTPRVGGSADSVGGSTDSVGGATPRVGGPTHSVAEGDPRSRPKDETQEADPGSRPSTPAFGGGETAARDSQGKTPGQPQSERSLEREILGAVSSPKQIPPRSSDFSLLRARLEKHT